MAEKPSDALARLQGMFDGTLEPPPRPTIDTASAPLFAALSRVVMEGGGEELAPGVLLRPTYAYVFAPPMVAVAPPPAPRAPHGGPWYALEGGGISETASVEVSIAGGANPFGIPRFAALRLIASTMRLLSAQPVCMPVLCNIPLADAQASGAPAHMWQLEQPPAIHGTPVQLTCSFNKSLAGLLSNLDVLMTDADLGRAFTLSDGMWWLPTREAQLTTVWTVIEMLMRPGRRDTTKELGRAVRAYASFDRNIGSIREAARAPQKGASADGRGP